MDTRDLLRCIVVVAACGCADRHASAVPPAPVARSAAASVDAAAPTSTLPPLPALGSASPSAAAALVAAGYRREADVIFSERPSNAKVRLLERDRNAAWFGTNGTMVTSGGSAGSIITGGRRTKIDQRNVVDVGFSNDGALAALSSGLAIYALATGKPIANLPVSSSCAARFASEALVILHEDGHDSALVHLDLSTRPPTAKTLGAARRTASRCVATSDGSVFLVYDSHAGVVWRIDGRTGASQAVLRDLDQAVFSASTERVCFMRRGREERDIVRCADGDGRNEEVVMIDAGLSSLEPSGKRLLLASGSAHFVADFATKTVRALYGARGKSGGTFALLDGGDVFAAGSASGVEFWDVATKTRSFISGAAFYGVDAIPGKPRAMLITTDSDTALYLAEVP